MQAMKCELCGSSNVVKQDGFFVCQHCGTKYTVEEAKKLLGTVKIDRSEETERYLLLAQRAKEENNAENAVKYYSLVAEEDPNNWEAAFFVAYFQYMKSDQKAGAYALANAARTAMKLIKENLTNDAGNGAFQHLDQYMTRALTMCDIRRAMAHNDKNHMGAAESASHTADIYIQAMEEFFPDQMQCIATVRNKREEYKRREDEDWKRVIDGLHRRRQQIARQAGGGGCYIATCVYGSYDCPPVWTLRRFRDFYLARTWYGRAFVRLYYRISPTLVKWFGCKQWFKALFSPFLARLVSKLQQQGYECTQYNDCDW